MGLKLVIERVVRREMADYLAVRQRPGTSQSAPSCRRRRARRRARASRRGTSSSSPPSAASSRPILPGAWWWVPVLLTLLVMLGRVYVGAHNPLDVTAGLGAGLLLGGVLAAFVE